MLKGRPTCRICVHAAIWEPWGHLGRLVASACHMVEAHPRRLWAAPKQQPPSLSCVAPFCRATQTGHPCAEPWHSYSVTSLDQCYWIGRAQVLKQDRQAFIERVSSATEYWSGWFIVYCPIMCTCLPQVLVQLRANLSKSVSSQAAGLALYIRLCPKELEAWDMQARPVIWPLSVVVCPVWQLNLFCRLCRDPLSLLVNCLVKVLLLAWA